MASQFSNMEVIGDSGTIVKCSDGSESLFGENSEENGRKIIGTLWNYIVVSNYWNGCFVHEAKIESSFDK